MTGDTAHPFNTTLLQHYKDKTHGHCHKKNGKWQEWSLKTQCGSALLVTSPKGHWSERSLVQRVTSPNSNPTPNDNVMVDHWNKVT